MGHQRPKMLRRLDQAINDIERVQYNMCNLYDFYVPYHPDIAEYFKTVYEGIEHFKPILEKIKELI